MYVFNYPTGCTCRVHTCRSSYVFVRTCALEFRCIHCRNDYARFLLEKTDGFVQRSKGVVFITFLFGGGVGVSCLRVVVAVASTLDATALPSTLVS
jgi:hypothetical protein